MKHIFTFLLLVVSIALFSQAPSYINYQGVARNSLGDPIANTTIGVRFELLQGNASGSVVFTEDQSIGTGTLGVFATRIGNSNPNGLNGINWKNGPYFLRVSFDPTNSQNFIALGSQQLLSVPYALMAQSVPTSYTNNILTIGNDTISLSSYTGGAGIAITSGSVITNTAPNQTVTLNSGNSNVSVSGAYPDFTVSASPSLSLLSPNTLSISEGNTVEIAPTLSFTNSILTVGPTTNTIVIPSPPNTSLVGTGAANIATLGVNAYSVNVPLVTLSPSTNVGVAGTFPNFTISSTPSLSLLGPNSLSISGANSVAIAPSIGLIGNTLSVGAPSNSIAIPGPTIQGNGAAVVTPSTGFNFQVTVPNTTMVPSGGGISISSPGTNSFNLSVPATTLTQGSNVTISGSDPNFTISATPSLSLLSPNTLSISGGNTVGIAPSLSFTNNVLTVGPNNNSVTIPTSTTSIVGTGIAQVTPIGPNSFSIDVATPQINGGTNVVVSGSYPSFTVDALPSLSLNGNTLAINGGTAVVLDTYTVSGPGLLMSGGPNYTISSTIPTTSISGAGIATVTPLSGNNFTVNVATPTFTGLGATSVLGAYPNYTIATPLPPQATVTGVGAAVVTPSTGLNFQVNVPVTSLTSTNGVATVSATGTNSFNLSVPAPSYNPVTGDLTTGSINTNITQALTFSNNILTSGPASNSIVLPPAATPTIFGAGIATVTPLTGNNFTVNVATPTFTGLGATSVLGSFPNYTIATPVPQATVTGSGAAVVSPSTGLNFQVNVPVTSLTSTNGVATVSATGTNSFDLFVPAPSYNSLNGNLTTGLLTTNITPVLTFTNNVLTAGPASNSISIPAPITPSILGIGAATVNPTSGNTFTVNVAPTLITATTGVANITPVGTNSFDINVPAPIYNQLTGDLSTGSASANITPTLGLSGNVLTVGPSSNTLLLPSSSVTMQSAGIATVSPLTGNNFTVNVATPTFSGLGATSVLGSYPNYTIATPIPQATVTGIGAAIVSPTTGLSFQVNVPPSVITSTSGVATVSTTGTNSFNIDVPAPIYNSLTGALTTGSISSNITPILTFTNNILTAGPTTNSVTLPPSVPPTIVGAGTASVTTAGNSFTVDVPLVNLSGSGASSIGGLFPNYTVVTPTTAITGSGAVTVSGAYPNYTVSVPSTSVTGSGMVIVTPTVGNSFVVDVPLLSYTPSTGALGSGSNSVSIVSPLSFTNSILTSGPNSNSVNLSAIGPWIQSANTVTLNVSTSSVGIGTSLPQSPLHVTGSTAANSGQVIYAEMNSTYNSTGGGVYGAQFVNNYSGSAGPQVLAGMNARLSLAGSNTSQFPAAAWLTTSNFSGGNHQRAMGVFASVENYGGTIGDAFGAYIDHLGSTGITNGYGVYTGGISGTNKWSFYASDASARSYFAGRVGIGNNTPTEDLQVESTSSSAQVSILSPNTQVSSLSFGTTLNHFMGNIRYDNTINSLNFWTNNTPNRLVIDANGNIGIGTANPGPHNLAISGLGGYSSIRMFNNTSLTFGMIIEQNSLSANMLNYENTPLNFGTNGLNRLTISPSGNVGIGTSAPSATLDVVGTVQIVDGTEGTGKVLTSDATGNASWQAVLPSGMVMAYAGNVVPTGWVVCDGSQVSRTGATANLFAAIGTAWGAGDGATTFHLPDMRGNFLRGVSDASTADPDRLSRISTAPGGNTGNNVGSLQNFQLQSHSHVVPNISTSPSTLLGGSGYSTGGSITTNATGGNETRPRNVYVYYIIKL